MITFFVVCFMGFAAIASAQNGVDGNSTMSPGTDGNTTVSPGSIGNAGIGNPLGTTTINDIANAILDILMIFAVPIILFFIVWAGFLYVTAGGNQDRITKATKALMYAVIGGVIVLGAKVLLEVINNTISTFG